MPLISEADSQRIAGAIAAAEKNTSGEIVAVVAAESSSYLYGPFLWAALIALIVPWPLIYFTWLPIHLIFLIQIGVFLLLLAIFLPRPNRYWLIPRSVMHENAHRRAVEQFLAQNLHTTHGRTGVLIYVSVAEHYAEILADTGIDKHVDQGTWQAIVDQLTGHLAADRPGEGFVAAIERCGALLAKHYPPGSADPNELPDHLIVLE